MSERTTSRPAAFVQQVSEWAWQSICGHCGDVDSDAGRLPLFQRLVQHLADEHGVALADGADVQTVPGRVRTSTSGRGR